MPLLKMDEKLDNKNLVGDQIRSPSDEGRAVKTMTWPLGKGGRIRAAYESVVCCRRQQGVGSSLTFFSIGGLSFIFTWLFVIPLSRSPYPLNNDAGAWSGIDTVAIMFYYHSLYNGLIAEEHLKTTRTLTKRNNKRKARSNTKPACSLENTLPIDVRDEINRQKAIDYLNFSSKNKLRFLNLRGMINFQDLATHSLTYAAVCAHSILFLNDEANCPKV